MTEDILRRTRVGQRLEHKLHHVFRDVVALARQEVRLLGLKFLARQIALL